MSDASWFVDDVGAYDKYEREEESDEAKVNMFSIAFFQFYFNMIQGSFGGIMASSNPPVTVIDLGRIPPCIG